jgi:hypothetical protein
VRATGLDHELRFAWGEFPYFKSTDSRSQMLDIIENGLDLPAVPKVFWSVNALAYECGGTNEFGVAVIRRGTFNHLSIEDFDRRQSQRDQYDARKQHRYGDGVK